MADNTDDEAVESELLRQMLEDAKTSARPPGSEEDHPAEWYRPALSVAELPAEPKKTYRESLVDEIQTRIDAQVAAVLAQPAVKRLHDAWRRLHELVEHLDFNQNIRLEVLACTRDELEHDFESATSVTASGLYARLCDAPASTSRAPVGLILCDLELSHHQQDIALLANLAAVAADSHAPLLTNGSLSFLGCDVPADLSELADIRVLLESPRYAAWRSFRDTEDARYVVVCMPSAASALATQIGEVFASSGGFDDLEGPTRMAVEAPVIGRHAKADLAAGGFTTVAGGAGECPRFDLPRTVYRPKRFADTAEGRVAAIEDGAKAVLSNTLHLCRLAHYLEAMAREMPEDLGEDEVEADLQAWLDQQALNLPGLEGARVSVTRPSYRRYELFVDCTFGEVLVTQALAGRLVKS